MPEAKRRKPSPFFVDYALMYSNNRRQCYHTEMHVAFRMAACTNGSPFHPTVYIITTAFCFCSSYVTQFVVSGGDTGPENLVDEILYLQFKG